MKHVLFGLMLVVGCHKKEASSGGGSAGSGDVIGSAVTSGTPTVSATAGSAKASNSMGGSAGVGSATAGVAGPQAAAVDALDRWIAPIYKLAGSDRYRAICHAANTIRVKADELRVMSPPSGVDAQAWTDANETFAGDVAGVGMCCQDLADYEKGSAALKEVADGQHDECLKPLPVSFAALAKLVPGAPTPGTHANDPVMKPEK